MHFCELLQKSLFPRLSSLFIHKLKLSVKSERCFSSSRPLHIYSPNFQFGSLGAIVVSAYIKKKFFYHTSAIEVSEKTFLLLLNSVWRLKTRWNFSSTALRYQAEMKCSSMNWNFIADLSLLQNVIWEFKAKADWRKFETRQLLKVDSFYSVYLWFIHWIDWFVWSQIFSLVSLGEKQI